MMVENGQNSTIEQNRGGNSVFVFTHIMLLGFGILFFSYEMAGDIGAFSLCRLRSFLISFIMFLP